MVTRPVLGESEGLTLRLPGQILQGFAARAALAMLRVYLGVVFLVSGVPKVGRDFTPTLAGFLERVALDKATPLYRRFVEAVVLPNVETFALLVTGGEVLAGIALVLGLCTRLAAAGALLMTLNYMLAKGAWFWTPSSNDAAFVAISVALLLGAAGRTFGLDAFLARRWPRGIFW
jgi:putative oxidoreductase